MDARETALKTLIQAVILALVFLAVLLILRATQVLLLIFGGILVAVLLRYSSLWIHRRTGLPLGWAIAATLLVPLLALGGALWIAAPEIAAQAAELTERVPASLRELRQQALQYEWVSALLEQQDRIRKALPSGADAAGSVATFFTSTFGALGNLLIVLVIGLFLAVSPGIYINGLIKLVPPGRRARTGKILTETGDALASWLLAKITAMIVIGVMTTIGLWIIGIDLALILGLIAALLSFIPNIGPIIALLPALLLAFIGGIDQAIYVVILYIGIQTFESYLLTPLLQQRMLDLPPALIITMQVLLGVLAGVLGVILATPLTAAATVMIRMWYVEDILGDRSTQEDGEKT